MPFHVSMKTSHQVRSERYAVFNRMNFLVPGNALEEPKHVAKECPTRPNDLPSVLQLTHEGLELFHEAAPPSLPLGEEAVQFCNLV